MANPSDKQMLRDANGDLIPQYWDITAGDFKPLTGSDGANDVRLTGSNVEYVMPVKSVGDKVVKKQLLGRGIRNAFTQSFDTNLDPTVKRIIIVLNVYGVTGTFDSGEGYLFGVRRHTRDTIQAYDVARTKFSTISGNYGGALITIDPSVGDKINGQSDNYLLVQDTLFPSYRIMLYVDGLFSEGEGVDCDVKAYYIY